MAKTRLLDDLADRDQLSPEIPSLVTTAVKISARQIVTGDRIVTRWRGGSPLKTDKVTYVEHDACSKHGTHVNHRGCYDYHAFVWVMN